MNRKSLFINRKSKRVKRILTFGVSLLILASIFFRLTTATNAAWYNPSWAYRKTIIITNNGGSQTNYPVEVQVDTQPLINAGKLQSDCDDMLFTSSDGVSTQSYFVDYCSNTPGVMSSIFVKVGSIGASGATTLYMYYGNAGSSANASAFSSVGYPSGVVLGTGADGDISVTADTNINTADTISSRACSDTTGGDAVIYTTIDNITGGSTTSIKVATATTSTCITTGDELLIFNARGSDSSTGDGKYEFVRISSISTTTNANDTFTLNHAVTNSYNGTTRKLVVQRVPNYKQVSLTNSGTDFTPSAWDGATNFRGGVMAFRATGTVSLASGTTINANGLGYAGGSGGGVATGGNAGESYDGASTGRGGNGASNGQTRAGGKSGDGGTTSPADGGTTTGAGGGGGSDGSGNASDGSGAAGGGGGYAGGGGGGAGGTESTTTAGRSGGTGGSAGTQAGGGGGGCVDTNTNTVGAGGNAGSNGGTSTGCTSNGAGGAAGTSGNQASGGGGSSSTGSGGGGGGGGFYGTAALTTLYFGSGGGGGGGRGATVSGANGGAGGGIVFVSANHINLTGSITSNGATGATPSTGGGGAGGGAGGSVLIRAVNDTGTWTSLVTASGGAGTTSGTDIPGGGAGGVGRIHIDYTDSSAPSTTPTGDTSQIPYAGSPAIEEAQISTATKANPVLSWRFDEGTGSSVSDTSTYNNTGTTSNTTWQNTNDTPDQTKRSAFLRFNGTTSFVSRANDPDFNFGTTGFTLTGWFRHPLTVTGTDTILAHFGSAGYKIYMKSTGVVCFGIDGDSTWTPANEACTTLTFNDSTWHHFAAVKTGTTSITIYVDGKAQTTTSSIIATNLDTGSTIYIGIDSDGTSNPWDGDIDEISIYSFALTNIQIAADMIDPSSALIGSNATDPLLNGLTGWWKLDETSGNPVDSSGNGNSLTNNGTTTFVTAMFNRGSSHNGTTQYFSTATSINTNSVSFWVNPASNTNNYLNLASGVYVTSSSGTITATGFTNPQIYVNGILNGTITASVWNHVVVTSSAAITANAVEFGRANAAFLTSTSKLDELRLYNRTLTPLDAQQLYNWAPGPVGWWKLDENGGTTANDSSGNSNTGTITPGVGKYVPGKYGAAYSFDGADSVVNAGSGSSLDDLPQLTVSGWVYATSLGESNTGIIVGKFSSASTFPTGGWFIQMSSPASVHVMVDYNTNHLERIAADNSFSLGAWHHLAVTWDGTQDYTKLHIYIDGTEPTYSFNNQTGSGRVSDAANSLYIGNNTTQARSFNGMVDDLKIYNYVRSSKQIRQDMGAAHPLGNSPSIYYKLDESNGSTINNSGIQTTAGTITTGTWLSPSSCKINSCVSLTATSSTISAGDTAYTDSLTGFTTSLWLNPQTLAVDRTIASKTNLSTQNSFLIRTDSSTSSEIRVYVASTTSDSSNYFMTSGLGLTASTWQHLEVVYDGTQTAASRVRVFKNGLPISGSVTGTIPASMTSGSTSNFKIGDSDITGSEGLIAYYDEFKFYSVALSPAEVLVDANAGSSASFSTLATQNDEGFSMPAAKAIWKMDENSGTNAADTSGNGYTASLVNTPVWTQGKFGSGVLLNGTTQRLDAGDPASGDLDFGTSTNFSISSWFKTTDVSSEPRIVSKGFNAATNGYRIQIYNDAATIAFGVGAAGSDPNSTAGQITVTITDGKWHHIVGVFDKSNNRIRMYYDGIRMPITLEAGRCGTVSNVTDLGISACTSLNASTTDTFGIGYNSTGVGEFLNGSVDDTRVYASALTDAQVGYLFNRGAPVAWFKFDDCTGSTGYNSAVTGNGDAMGMNTTLSIGNTSTYTSTGNCNSGTATESWNGGTTGKNNAALALDGTDDFAYAMVTNLPTGDFTYSMWVKPNSVADSLLIEHMGTTSANLSNFRIQITAGIITVILNDTIYLTSTNALSTGVWTYVTATRSGSSIKLYYNGVQDPTTGSYGTAITTNASCALVIGQDPDTTTGASNCTGSPSQYFNGLIDDIKIYNYAQTLTQILTDMNQKSGIRFGPQTGSP